VSDVQLSQGKSLVLAGPQNQSGHSGQEKNPRPCQERNPGHPNHSLITILTEVSWLLIMITNTTTLKNV